jgi:hypothetical protein
LVGGNDVCAVCDGREGKELLMKTASALACAALLLAALLALGRLAHVRDAGAAEAITLDFDASIVGETAVAVLRMVPYAIPNLLAGALAVGTVGALVLWRLSLLPLMAGGAAIGCVLRARLS